VRGRPDGWFARGWAGELADALACVVRRLRARHGSHPDRWAWGRIRPLTLAHPLSQRRPLDRIFNLGPFPWGGDTNTVAQAAVDPLDPTANTFFMPSLRMVLDIGNWDESRFALPGGQSGNPLSSHYADLLDFWRRGDGVPILWSRERIDRAARSTLDIVPIGPHGSSPR